MTIKELMEELSKYDENTTISFWNIEYGYQEYLFIDDDDSLRSNNRVDIMLKQKESE